LRTLILLTGLVTSLNVVAAPDPKYCELVGSLARGITEDRDRGVAYNAELGKIRGAAEGMPGAEDILTISKAALKTSYLDMPKLTPEGAYKLYYFSCMASK